MTTVAVAGATGLVGRHVVDALRNRQVGVVPIARSHGVDLVSGRGVHAALYGVSAVIDVSNVITTRSDVSRHFFRQATANLVRAGQRSGVGRYVVLSIVGTADLPYGYYAGKQEQERIVRGSGLSASILHATQFHEFAGQTLDRFSVGPIGVVPAALCRPVAAAAVGERLVDLALAHSAPAQLDLAGPEVLYLPEMARRLCRHRRQRRLVLSVRLPNKLGRAMADGALLPTDPYETDPLTFDEWLGTQPRGPRGEGSTDRSS
jgi:uncharacterized protein YbjT (DUF2867 family)